MFAIDKDNGIRYVGLTQTIAANETPFETFEEFVSISQVCNWSKEDITDIWNSFAGSAGPFADLKQQKQVKNRGYGLQKIWDAIQRLTPESPGKLQVPGAKKPRKTATKADKKPKGPREKKNRQSDGTPRPGSHLETLIRMISRKTGASITEIMIATGWTATHTVRGMISKLCSKGKKIESMRTEGRGRVYRAVA